MPCSWCGGLASAETPPLSEASTHSAPSELSLCQPFLWKGSAGLGLGFLGVHTHCPCRCLSRVSPASRELLVHLETEVLPAPWVLLA